MMLDATPFLPTVEGHSLSGPGSCDQKSSQKKITKKQQFTNLDMWHKSMVVVVSFSSLWKKKKKVRKKVRKKIF